MLYPSSHLCTCRQNNFEDFLPISKIPVGSTTPRGGTKFLYHHVVLYFRLEFLKSEENLRSYFVDKYRDGKKDTTLVVSLVQRKCLHFVNQVVQMHRGCFVRRIFYENGEFK